MFISVPVPTTMVSEAAMIGRGRRESYRPDGRKKWDRRLEKASDLVAHAALNFSATSTTLARSDPESRLKASSNRAASASVE